MEIANLWVPPEIINIIGDYLKFMSDKKNYLRVIENITTYTEYDMGCYTKIIDEFDKKKLRLFNLYICDRCGNFNHREYSEFSCNCFNNSIQRVD